ncbi:MAG: FAD-dependent oxidoreductase, partial [Candidatus Binatia bacterium]
MLLDLREMDSPGPFEADICIIGAGAAGIAIAREFLDSRIKVCLVESGGLTSEDETQQLATGENVGRPYYPLELARFREFGGSTGRWGGACAPLNDLDFEHRPWVPHSGWPIGKRDLEPFYARAQTLFEVGAYDYQPQNWEGNGIRFLDFTPDTVVTQLWQMSPETNFGVAYRKPLQQSQDVTVLLHANVTEIITDERAASVKGVRVVTLVGKSATVNARVVILACGGIENARMLLLTNKVEATGLGNRHDLVGRFFMEHPHVASAGARFESSKKWLKSYKDYKQRGVWVRAGICLSAAAQRSHRVLNYSGILVDRFIRDTANHREVSGYLSLKSIALNLRKGRLPRNMRAHM